ncbi:hypothetical protein D3C72_1440450 [compost metagenome]
MLCQPSRDRIRSTTSEETSHVGLGDIHDQSVDTGIVVDDVVHHVIGIRQNAPFTGQTLVPLPHQQHECYRVADEVLERALQVETAVHIRHVIDVRIDLAIQPWV